MLLEVKNLSAGYKGMRVIEGISLGINKDEMVAIVGPNGSGKTTLLRALVGIIEEYGGRIYTGDIIFAGEKINCKHPYELLRLGLAFVPDGGKVFPSMTVLENLEMGGFILQDRGELRLRIAEVLELFPLLKALLKKKAGSLSGGERQLLSLGKALITHPSVLILDEPTAGLSPNYARIIFEKLRELKQEAGVMVVEQNAKMVLKYCDRGYVIRYGKIALEEDGSNLLMKEDVFKLL
ncbi:MAG: ABC transporter ATP-binding protein [candidate division WOR-3 bacterium]